MRDDISIDDSVPLTSSRNPEHWITIFYEYQKKYNTSKDEADLLLAYVLLQAYLENFFHYWLRLLVGGGFPNLKIANWSETDDVRKKLDLFERYLSRNKLTFDYQDFDLVRSFFSSITNVRNKILHGHPITQTHYAGKLKLSKTKQLLNINELEQSYTEAQTISIHWNNIMNSLHAQEPIASGVLPEGNFFKYCKLHLK